MDSNARRRLWTSKPFIGATIVVAALLVTAALATARPALTTGDTAPALHFGTNCPACHAMVAAPKAAALSTESTVGGEKDREHIVGEQIRDSDDRSTENKNSDADEQDSRD